MTSERLLTFLKNPDELERITYQELKTLSLAYPYSANFRMLLLLKSDQEKHWEKAQNLALAALYTPDRARMFELMAPRLIVTRHLDAETVESFLELKPIATAEREIAAKKSAEIEIEIAQPLVSAKGNFETPIFLEKKSPIFEEKNQVKSADFSTKNDPARPEKSERVLPPQVVSFENLMRKSVEKTPVSAFIFADWYGQFKLPILPPKKGFKIAQIVENQPVSTPKTSVEVLEKVIEKTAQNLEPTEPDLEKLKEAAVKKLVKKSVKEKDEIVSETLARVYQKQGYKEKSIAMYQKLILVFPEKNATFAAEIEKMSK
jgi:tetratricopeptide (TPR) repeat protein